MSDANVRGRILWHELNTTDQKAAAAFYLKAVGWTTQAWDENPSYVMFAAGGRPMAGLLALGADAGGRPNWLTYIGTPNLESTVRQAQALGATILKPAEGVPAVGTWVVLKDPQGAVFAVLQPSQSPSDAEPGLGDFSWHELATTDAAGALKFYQQLFGWEETGAMDMGPDLGMYHMYGKGGRPMGGIYKKPSDPKAPAHMQASHWLPYVLVTDTEKAADATKKAGGQVASGPMEVPGGDWIAIGIDPQGGAFAVHSRQAAVPAVPTSGQSGGAKKSAAKKSAAKKGAAKKGARKAAEKTARTARKASRKGAGKAAKKTAKKALKKAAKKAAKKSSKKTAIKSAKKVPRRTIKKTAKKSSKKRAAKKR
jgi:predicted enzyme related to lactoylglutathione lyase